MTNPPSTNAQPASPNVPQRREWTKPVLDILALANAEQGLSFVNDHKGHHKSG